MKPFSRLSVRPVACAALVLALVLAALSGCSPMQRADPAAPGVPTAPAAPATPPAASAPLPQPPLAPADVTSAARTAREYRQDAARHLYARQSERIFKGRLPPMLYAVGVLDIDIDRRGQVQALNWQRAPRHAPEVMAEIEKMVRAAAPYPVPKHMPKVTYTDVWLWHKSGRFQLDTLTEGQD